MQHLQKWLHESVMMRNAPTPDQFRQKLLELKAAELESAGINPVVATLPASSTLWALRKRLGVAKCQKPSKQTPRRQEVGLKTFFYPLIKIHFSQAIGDLRAFISLGALFKAVLELPDGPRVPPELLFNLDATGTAISHSVDDVFVMKKSMKLLRKEGRSLACTKEESMNRFAHLYPVISASGELLCTVSVVFDTLLTTPSLQLV